MEAAAPPQAAAAPPMPFLGDDIFVLIAAELEARMLGRLACTAQHFWRESVPDPAHQGRAPAELWSVAEEGKRRRLCAQSEQVRGWVCRGGVGGSWLRALGGRRSCSGRCAGRRTQRASRRARRAPSRRTSEGGE
jgi:hypothetical protein